MKRSSLASTVVGALGGLALFAAAGQAADLPELKFTAIGSPSMVNAWKVVQEPFFNKTLPQDSGGKITASAKPHDQAGIDMKEAVKMAMEGSVQVVFGAFQQLAGDNPRFEAIDLPGIGATVAEARAAANAYRPVVGPLLEKQLKLKLLAIHPNTMQVVFCKTKINSLEDFKGKKVRVWSRAIADYFDELGSVSVNIPFVEVLPAMQQGVADCGVTSPANGNTARWWEVTKDLLVLPAGGWAIGFFGANIDFWNKLDPRVQAFLVEEFKKVEDRGWQQGGVDLQDGIDCNLGKKCEFGIVPPEGKRMNATYPSPADLKRHGEVMKASVLKKWAARCGADCVDEWNNTIGKVVGFTAPKPGT